MAKKKTRKKRRSKTQSARTRTPGRPRPTAGPTPVVVVEPSRCKKCGSTDREHYSHTTVRDIAGVRPDGMAYSKIFWRRTRCQNCGQARIDKTYE